MAATLIERYKWTPTVLEGTTPVVGLNIVVFDSIAAKVLDLTTIAGGTVATQVLQNQILSETGPDQNWDNTSPSARTPHRIRLLEWGYRIEPIQSTISQETAPVYFVSQQSVQEVANLTAGLAIAGITYDHPSELIEITGNIDMRNFYDRGYAEDLNNPQYAFDFTVDSTDGNNFTSFYEVNVNGGVTFDGEGKSLSVPAPLTVQTTGQVTNMSVTGGVIWGTQGTITGLNADVLTLTTAGSVTLDGCQIGELINTSGGAITVTLANGSSVTTNTGPNITIPTGSVFSFTVSPVPTPNYEWRLYSVTAIGSLDGAVELDGAENETASGGTYNNSFSNQAAALQIISDDYKESTTYITLTASDLNINVPLEVDTND